MDKQYNMNFRCFFGNEIPAANYSSHYQALAVKDIPRWIEAYQFTHPNCTSISCKVWLVNNEQWQEPEERKENDE